jgi:hypothetical protein
MEETFTLLEFFEFLIRLSYLIYGIDRESESFIYTVKNFPLISSNILLGSCISKLLKNDIIPNLPLEVAVECQYGEFRGQFNVLKQSINDQKLLMTFQGFLMHQFPRLSKHLLKHLFWYLLLFSCSFKICAQPLFRH